MKKWIRILIIACAIILALLILLRIASYYLGFSLIPAFLLRTNTISKDEAIVLINSCEISRAEVGHRIGPALILKDNTYRLIRGEDWIEVVKALQSAQAACRIPIPIGYE